MLKNSRPQAAIAACALLFSASPAMADPPALPEVSFGIQGLALVGVHRDIGGDQHGIGAGPLGEIRAGNRRLAIDVEGLPVASEPQRASAFYGQATPSLGLVNATAEVAAGSRMWLGIGTTIVNQRTPLPAISQVVSSRLAGVRFLARYRIAGRGAHFSEAVFGAAPALSGTDRFLYSDGFAPVNKDERASELDASVGLGYRVRNTEWIFGLRALNFSARFTRDNSAGDRNVGIGAMVEWRRVVRP